MSEYGIQVKALLDEMEKLHKKKELSSNLPEDYFEPGEMEYLDQYEGLYDESERTGVLCFEVKGTQYEGRTEEIEKIKIGDPVIVLRDAENQYNSNNFRILSNKNRDLGNMPADLCNVLAPLYDSGKLTILGSKVSFVEPISVRSRYATKGIIFICVTFELQKQDL